MDRRGETEAFAELVYALIREIPKGRVTSYGAIARALGRPSSSRLVGRILGRGSHASPPVPAHRVVNSAGVLSGREAFSGAQTMQTLLEEEGIVVRNNKIANFNRVFWDPLHEL